MDKMVYARIAFYILSPLISAIPVSLTGLVAVKITENGHLFIDANLPGIMSTGAAAAVTSLAVYLKWGKK